MDASHARGWLSARIERIRAVRWTTLLAVSTVVAVVVVLTALHFRREGSRTAAEAFVPLRQPTAAEAVELVRQGADSRYPQSAILGEDGGDLRIGTRLYVLPRDRSDPTHEQWVDENDSSAFRTSSATWESYYSLYRVSRADYEAALGRSLEPADFTSPRFVRESEVSFDPTRIPLYAAIEIAFLSLWLFSALKILLWIRRPTALLPPLFLLLLVPLPFVRIYAPALIDADWFFQRIVVELFALYCFGLCALLYIPALASSGLWVLFRGVDRLAARRAASTFRYRVVALWAIAALGVIGLTVEYVRYRREAAACFSDRDFVTTRVAAGEWVGALLEASEPLPRAANLMKDPGVDDPVTRAVHAVLDATGDRPTQNVVVLTPATGEAGEHLFLWRRESVYADFRQLESGFANQIDAEAYDEIRRRGTYSTSLIQWLGWSGNPITQHLCGTTLEVRGRSVLVAVSRPFSR